MLCLGNLGRQTQVLVWSYLDEKFRQRSLLLLSKICKAHSIIPSSYILRRELIRIGRVYYCGGFADVCKGEYLGLSVAVKRLRMNGVDRDRIFKVFLVNLADYHCSDFPSGCVGRSSVGNIYPIQISCLCWEFLRPQSHIVSTFLPSGCLTEM